MQVTPACRCSRPPALCRTGLRGTATLGVLCGGSGGRAGAEEHRYQYNQMLAVILSPGYRSLGKKKKKKETQLLSCCFSRVVCQRKFSSRQCSFRV